MIPPFKKIQVADEDVQRVQDNVSTAFATILKNPILDTVLIRDVALKAGQDNLVPHTLVRRPLLWIPVKRDANAVIWELPNKFYSKFINLRTSADCTVSLLVG